MARSNIRKRKAPGKALRSRRPRMRRTTNVPEWASLSESQDFQNTFVVGTSYNFNNMNLASFPRAAAVAQGYQYFKIKKVKFEFQPLIDTFIATAPGATQVPYLTWVINKTGSSYVGLTKDWYLQNGAKPIRFDDKTIKVAYAPAVVIDVAESGQAGIANQPNLPKTNQWLTTNADAFGAVFNPSTVSHTGHYLLVSSEGSTQAMNYRVTMTAEFQFKKPLSRLPSQVDRGYHTVINV